MLHIDCILHATDYSTHSAAALNVAAALARDFAARLIVLHVAATLGPELVSSGEAASDLEPESHQRKVWAELRKVVLPDPTVTLEYRLSEGDPATEIIRAARDSGCGLIVMASHGRSGWTRLLLGSVAEQVMRAAPCPVLVVKSSHGMDT